MRSALVRIDAWCRRGDFTIEDVAWLRVIYSAGLLLTLQPFGLLSNRPAERFDPPPGPLMLFESLPSHGVLEGLEILTAVLAALLLVGLHTRSVSILLALALMTGLGLTYSFGKIDHTIVLALVPLWMAFSDWGKAMSFDAAERRGTESLNVAQWPLRFLAVSIALMFFTGGWYKLRSGWLDLDTHAVQGHFGRSFLRNERTDWLAPQIFDLRLGRLWEAADWFTVALELGLVVTVLSWQWFRVSIAFATLFHVGVLMTLNIVFSWNIFGYAAFVRWNSIVPWPTFEVRIRRSLGYVFAMSIGVVMYAVHEGLGPDFQSEVRTVIVFLGGSAGIVYLAYLALRLGRSMRVRPAATRS
jgi:hypothetical protein